MYTHSVLILALGAVGSALAAGHDFDKRAPHARLLKRYPPDRATVPITSTPAYDATTIVPALGTATPRRSGAFNPNATFNPLAASPTTCAPTYTAPTMIRGTGTLPKPSTFVQKDFRSKNLRVGQTPFTIVGPSTFESRSRRGSARS